MDTSVTMNQYLHAPSRAMSSILYMSYFGNIDYCILIFRKKRRSIDIGASMLVKPILGHTAVRVLSSCVHAQFGLSGKKVCARPYGSGDRADDSGEDQLLRVPTMLARRSA